MKKRAVCFAVAMVVLSTVLTACSIGGGSQEPADKKQTSTALSYSEKASYYDQLVAGENDPIPLTTALNSAVTIEGDATLLEDDLYQKVVNLANQVFPRMLRGRQHDRAEHRRAQQASHRMRRSH